MPRRRARALRLGLLVLAAALGIRCGGDGGSPTGPGPGPTPAPLSYVALGASDAVGIGAFPPSEGYVYLLARRMEEVRSPVTLLNLGINGAVVDEIAAQALERAARSGPLRGRPRPPARGAPRAHERAGLRRGPR